MIDSFDVIGWPILRASLFLSVASVLALVGLMLTRSRSSRMAGIVWTMVLFSGLFVVPAQIEIPWYAAAAQVGETLPQPVAKVVSSPVVPAKRPALGTIAHRGDGKAIALTSQITATGAANRWNRTTNHLGLTELATQSFPIVWFAGLFIIATFSMISYGGLLWTLRETWLPQQVWQREFTRAADEMGVGRRPKLLVHASMGPMICLTPRGHRLIIPSDQWSKLRSPQRDVVLKHELAHYVRRDVWRTLSARLIVLVHWFNPLAWFAAQRAEESAEWSADRIAIGDQPSRAADLADALVRLAQHTHGSRLFASAARGRSLAARLRHLIHQTNAPGDEPILRRGMLVIVMSAVLMASAVKVRLVAQETEAATGEAVADREMSRVSVDDTGELATKLVGSDELTQQFKEALTSEPGALVMRDRAGRYEAIARADARADAIPNMFDRWFEPNLSSDRLVIRRDQREFTREFVAASEALNIDIEELRAALAVISARLQTESDLEKIVHRFLTDDAASIVFYVRQLKPQLRPGLPIVERAFADLLAKRADGKYAIRSEAISSARERIDTYDQRIHVLDRLRIDLNEFAGYITSGDDIADRIVTALRDPIVQAGLALPIFAGDRINRQRVERIVNQFEGGFREGPSGLVVRDDVRERLEQMLTGLERVAQGTEYARQPLAEFIANVSDEDELHRDLKRYLASDLSLARVAGSTMYANAKIEQAVDRYFSNFLTEDDDGRLRVDTSNVPEENVLSLVSGIFRESRRARRNGREVMEYVARVADPELQSVMQSPGGKIAIGDELIKLTSQPVSGGLDQWIADHLQEEPDGYSIRADRRDAIDQIVRQVEEVKRELDDADF